MTEQTLFAILAGALICYGLLFAAVILAEFRRGLHDRINRR